MSLRTRLQRLQRAAEGHHAERQADEALRTALERARARVDAWARQEAIETGDLEEYRAKTRDQAGVSGPARR